MQQSGGSWTIDPSWWLPGRREEGLVRRSLGAPAEAGSISMVCWRAQRNRLRIPHGAVGGFEVFRQQTVDLQKSLTGQLDMAVGALQIAGLFLVGDRLG